VDEVDVEVVVLVAVAVTEGVAGMIAVVVEAEQGEETRAS